ncbi:hypothetical protein PPACK8108_LOCUS20694 [Phakopsora pachyrhizi]|uniref:Uncharacterized protein n=1 Tax=Phakopsora pachyrhizi TaxID=170000 RepID=A0AAV0BFM7_PHAPC|nr:hypothetical protein PPACK8108_LOCUS20694 [Phakopsora pachyrhizi]
MPLQLNRNNKLRGLIDYDWQEAKTLKEVSEMYVVDAGYYYGFEDFEDDYCDDDIQQMNLQADGSEIDDVDGYDLQGLMDSIFLLGKKRWLIKDE